jgi:hypothetical protein
VIEADAESFEIRLVRAVHRCDQLDLGHTLLPRAQHNRRTMRVVRAHVRHVVSAQTLKTHPDIRLNVFDEMPDVNMAVGIGQGTGDENPARFRHADHAAPGCVR